MMPQRMVPTPCIEPPVPCKLGGRGGYGMAKLCEGRVAIVPGAGRGIGGEYALMLAAHGAKVVVNALGGARDGSGASGGPAEEVVAEIHEAGGEAIANGADVSDFASARQMIEQAI